jgi:hypothetical protein
MSLELTVEASAHLEQSTIQGNIILEIDGFDALYGAVKVTKVATIGEFVIGDGTLIGGAISDETSKDYISMSGTTNNITQQLNQDSGGSSSVTSFNVRLIDYNDELSNDFSPGVVVEDILGQQANIYWQAVGTKHPEDSARLFVGIISAASFGQGSVDIRVDHPEQLKRQDLLPKATSKLNAPLSSVATIGQLESIDNFLNPQENLTSYVKINDEIIKVQAFDLGFINVLTRGQFGTIPSDHEAGDDVESFYVLSGSCTELALRIMLSDPEYQNFAEKKADRIVQISPSVLIDSAIHFSSRDIEDELGLVVGDLISLTTGADVSNLFGYTEIIGFGKSDSGSYVIVNKDDLVPEIDIDATCLFKSKYNKLNFGCALKPSQIDVKQFEFLDETYGAQFFNYEFPIDDTINAKEFIDKKILYPSSLFSLPRKGRVSAGISAPPIIGPNVKTINNTNVTKQTGLKLRRSFNESFYNSVVYKIDKDVVEDKFLGAVVTTSQKSTRRVNIGNRPLTIECDGIKNTQENLNKIKAISERYLDRYQYGAESLIADINFKTAFSIEPGDTVILDGESLGLTDITTASKKFLPRVMEVINNSINLKNGKGNLLLQDTNLSTQRRYGTIAPASLTDSGSTTSKIYIKKSFATGDLEIERDRWKEYIQQKVMIRNEDFTKVYETSIARLSPSNPNVLEIHPALPEAPGENWIIEPPEYDESDAFEMRYWKALHCFFNYQIAATSGTTSQFSVAPIDFDKILKGAPVVIHNEDFTEFAESEISDITGATFTLTDDIEFTITSNHLVELIGFKDGGSPYAWY